MGTKHYLTNDQANYSEVGLVNKPHSAISPTLSTKAKKSIFGYELILDLSGCDLSIMSSKKKLIEYVNKLCNLIGMKKYGETHLPYFGLEEPFTKGYSLLQFIETSSITGHFSEHWRKSYINIFSCKKYDHQLAEKFTKEFFKAESIKSTFLIR